MFLSLKQLYTRCNGELCYDCKCSFVVIQDLSISRNIPSRTMICVYGLANMKDNITKSHKSVSM